MHNLPFKHSLIKGYSAPNKLIAHFLSKQNKIFETLHSYHKLMYYFHISQFL